MRKTIGWAMISIMAIAAFISCEAGADDLKQPRLSVRGQERMAQGAPHRNQERGFRNFSEEERQKFRENAPSRDGVPSHHGVPSYDGRQMFLERMRQENPGLSDEQLMAMQYERFMERMRRRHPEMSDEQLKELMKERFSANAERRHERKGPEGRLSESNGKRPRGSEHKDRMPRDRKAN